MLMRSSMASRSGKFGGLVTVSAGGVEGAADLGSVQSPETYVGYERGENFISPCGVVRDMRHAYSTPSSLQRNQWALGATGRWKASAPCSTAPADDISPRLRRHSIGLLNGRSTLIGRHRYDQPHLLINTTGYGNLRNRVANATEPAERGIA
jgi:hypothetical protein